MYCCSSSSFSVEKLITRELTLPPGAAAIAAETSSLSESKPSLLISLKPRVLVPKVPDCAEPGPRSDRLLAENCFSGPGARRSDYQ